ncbi:MAG: response regulator transcription factor [Spirochaetaceae bacterium]|nr:response regulator transcription factor [Spirochaetaceae bacterium]
MLIRVGIADDEDLVRDGIAALLASRTGLIVVSTVSTAAEAIELAGSGAIDVLLLDVQLGGRGGIDALEEIVRRTSNHGESPVRVIMVSSMPEEEYGIRAIRAGASGYIPKASEPGLLEEAVRSVASGKRFITPRIAELLAEFAEHGSDLPHQRLSHRETIVFERLAAGRSVTEIADELALSASTVSTYRGRILEKLRLQSTAEIIRYAAHHGLV